MATVLPQTGQIQSGIRSVLGRISHLFTLAPDYTVNEKWHDDIHVDTGEFLWFYFLSRDLVQVCQDLQALRERQVGIFGFAETNLVWNKPYVKMDYLEEQRKVWQLQSQPR